MVKVSLSLSVCLSLSLFFPLSFSLILVFSFSSLFSFLLFSLLFAFSIFFSSHCIQSSYSFLLYPLLLSLSLSLSLSTYTLVCFALMFSFLVNIRSRCSSLQRVGSFSSRTMQLLILKTLPYLAWISFIILPTVSPSMQLRDGREKQCIALQKKKKKIKGLIEPQILN